mmetsp:Transcript_971/g.1527  ORF Transcript_971/g.1527 Transcript_971/m.1527 type:complete len:221 (-) Transcript_971:559-1221(-)|eukprot:CAMPEP_0119107270 /NCGR_PEP_ID=MMETSP1180-20130426/9609_1 /TAXON_ID=3052 ORGANISM="Chlamydomonas cf sp, Strain CCMP681" /NCGR_SAMPLE_ID=MMETSP1180 /ASSEMBLY_ACC=CAM_ASM_000741 /LENGTH=220 /DNA_ID=CAMNT_0007092733 /DNA_START=119 /DNA_END=781 /DNA_ORIENTATION=-
MSTARGAKLKAQYNRVRTSTSLRANDMWTNTIGLEQDPQAGSNSAIEAAIYAPTVGGASRVARRELAQQLIKSSGYQPSVTDYQGLLTLAKAQGSLGEGSRGACKLCGGIGHRDKQCTNFLTGHTAAIGLETVAAATALGVVTGAPIMGLLPDPGDISDLSDLSSDSDDGSSSSGSDSEQERKRSSKKRKRSKGKKEKKEKKSKKSKSKKTKKSKKSRSD